MSTARAETHLRDFIKDLVTEGAKTGDLRGDMAPAELASYCLHPLGVASGLPSKAAVRRLVAATPATLITYPQGHPLCNIVSVIRFVM